MIVVVDVNALLSALIKDSVSRDIIINSRQDFCFPEPSLHKIRKYKSLILEKAGISELEFLAVFNTLFKFIRIIPVEELIPHWDEAKKVMEHIDPEDVTIVATALSQENLIVWSDDAHFDRQNKVLVLKTKDMIFLFKNKLCGIFRESGPENLK